MEKKLFWDVQHMIDRLIAAKAEYKAILERAVGNPTIKLLFINDIKVKMTKIDRSILYLTKLGEDLQ